MSYVDVRLGDFVSEQKKVTELSGKKVVPNIFTCIDNKVFKRLWKSIQGFQVRNAARRRLQLGDEGKHRSSCLQTLIMALLYTGDLSHVSHMQLKEGSLIHCRTKPYDPYTTK